MQIVTTHKNCDFDGLASAVAVTLAALLLVAAGTVAGLGQQCGVHRQRRGEPRRRRLSQPPLVDLADQTGERSPGFLTKTIEFTPELREEAARARQAGSRYAARRWSRVFSSSSPNTLPTLRL